MTNFKTGKFTHTHTPNKLKKKKKKKEKKKKKKEEVNLFGQAKLDFSLQA
jgi:hypothetical protein